MERQVVITILVKPIDETEGLGSRGQAIESTIQGITQELRHRIPDGEKPVAFNMTTIEPKIIHDPA